MAKLIIEHGDDVRKVSPELKEYGLKEFAVPAGFVVPFHPGSIKYFREIGLWTPANDARQKELLAKLPKPGTKAK